MKRVAIVAFFIASSVISSMVAQDAPIRTIHGVVLDAVTGSPIPRATVALSCVPRTLSAATQALTDTSGSFQFINLQASVDEPTMCSAQVTRNGYLPFSESVSVAATLTIKLIPQSVITGIVLDEHGQPLPSAYLSASHRDLTSGSYSIQQARGARTDDRGRFRIAGMAADAYRICVTPPRVPHLAAGGTAYDRICFPGSPEEKIHLKPGEARDLRFDFKPLPAVRLAGHLTNATSPPTFQLSRETADGFLSQQDDHRWNPATSTFEFPAVIPGTYHLTVDSVSPARARAQRAFVVGSSNLSDLELTLEPLHELEGIVREDDGATPQLELLFERKSEISEEAHSDERGAFRLLLSELQPYEVRIGTLPWHVQSIKQAGRDVVGAVLEPLPDGSWGKVEIVASRSAGSIEGTLRAAPDPPATDQLYFVRVLQEHNSGYRWVTGATWGSQFGKKFRIDNLPPGEYRILLSKAKAAELLPYLEPAYLSLRAEFVAIVRVTAGQTSQVVVSPVPDDSDPMADR